MKKNLSTIILGVSLLLALLSCDGQKKQVSEFAEKIAEFVATNDTDSLNTFGDVNSESKKLETSNKIEISKNQEDSIWRVNYSPEVWIDMTINQEDQIRVINSHGISNAAFGKLCVALNTGMITTSESASEINSLLNDDDYFNWYNKKIEKNLEVLLTLNVGKVIAKVDPLRGEGLYMLSAPFSVKNNSEKEFTPGDYRISYMMVFQEVSDGSEPDILEPAHADGIYVEPGQTAEGTIMCPTRCANIKDFKIEFTLSPDKMFEFVHPNGTEYKQYLQEK